MTISTIKQDIVRLPPSEVAELLSWLANYHARVWALKTAGDPAAGRFAGLLDELQAEIQADLQQTNHSGK